MQYPIPRAWIDSGRYSPQVATEKTWLALFINVNSPWSLSVEGYGIAIHVFLHTFVILYHFTYPRVN